MKQISQDISKGATYITEAPSPVASRESVLIASKVSLISAGTERMLVGFGQASMLDKARQQPDKLKMVLEKIQTDGLMTTIEAVQSELAQPLPLGYCNVGVVANGFGADLHILFLTDNFSPESNAPASRTFEHCREWVRAGHQVTNRPVSSSAL